MQTQNTRVLRRLNDAWRIAYFDAVVAAPFMGFAFVGFVTDQKTVFLTIGFAASYGLQKLKAARHPAFLSHYFRWITPSWLHMNWFKSFPPPDDPARLG